MSKLTYSAKAYGFYHKSSTFEGLVEKIDRYGEKFNKRAVSIVATVKENGKIIN